MLFYRLFIYSYLLTLTTCPQIENVPNPSNALHMTTAVGEPGGAIFTNNRSYRIVIYISLNVIEIVVISHVPNRHETIYNGKKCATKQDAGGPSRVAEAPSWSNSGRVEHFPFLTLVSPPVIDKEPS